MWKTILAATDGSHNAGRAVNLAAELAATHDATLVLLHVLHAGPVPKALRHLADVEHITEPGRKRPPDVPLAYSSPSGDRDWGAEYRIHEFIGKRILEKAKKTAQDAGVKNVETVVDQGDASARILAQARERGADAIVLGSRGLGQLKELLIGSVSHKVTSVSPVTCIIVK